MAEEIRLTEEELGELEAANKRISALRAELADISIAKLNLKVREQRAETFFLESGEQEKALAKKLEDKYGKGVINIDEGTFVPQQG